MSSSGVLGQYLWHELLTTDPEAGAGFYSKVLGWKQLPYTGEPGYTMLGTAQGPVGGVRVVGRDSLAGTAGPNWLTYVGVPDIAATLAAVQTKGGRVIHPVTAIPADGGRYAVIADPQGGIIGVYEPGAGMSGGDAGAPAGPVVWHELTADNAEAALQFYQAIFGWEVVATHAMGGEVGTYYIFGVGKTQLGGAFNRPGHLAPTWPRWLVYLAVPSVTAAVAAVQAAGGRLLNGPNQVPGGNWVAQVIDSHGVPVALHGPKEVAPAKVKPEVQTKAKPKAKAKAKARVKVMPKVKVMAMPKAKPKAKAKTKSKAKAKKNKAKTKAKTKAKAAPKSKAAARRRTARKTARKTARRRASRKR